MTPEEELAEPQDLPSALAWLGAEDPRRRTLAAKALGRQGTAVVEAVPQLVRALEDVDPMVRSMVASALGRIGSPAAVPALMQRLADPVVPVRFWSVEALGRIATPAPGLADLLERLARDDEAHVRAAAARALARLRARPGSGSA